MGVDSMAAPTGNTNARKGRLFEQALTREIKQRDLKDGDGETLRKIAAKLVDTALDGDRHAIAEIRDTLDGKPAQTVQHTGDAENPVVHRVADLVFDAVLERAGLATEQVQH